MTELRRLIPLKRGQGRLQEAPTRAGIAVARSEASPSAPSGVSSSGGITSPLVEQTYAGSTYYTLTSSDGLFVIEFADETTYIDDDGAGDSYVVKHIDPDA